MNQTPMRVMVCQTNSCVGDLRGNLLMMKSRIQEAVSSKYDVIVFPELVTTGYPPRDLLYSEELWDSHDRLVENLHKFVRQQSSRVTVIFGGLHRVERSYGRVSKYNAAYIMSPEDIKHVHKRLLPYSDIFNENRYFESGLDDPYLPIPITYGDNQTVWCDVIICEDMWNYKNRDTNPLLHSSYTEDPVSQLRGDGPVFILNGSPYWQGKFDQTKRQVEDICLGLKRPVVWVNQIGAHDDIVTAGYSMVCLPDGATPPGRQMRVGNMFEEDMIGVSFYGNEYGGDLFPGQEPLPEIPGYDPHTAVTAGTLPARGKTPRLFGKKVDPEDYQAWFNWEAMRLHLQDYARRCGFKKIVLGQSGGIDSALVAAVARFTLGPQNVISVTMPSKYSSSGSVDDSAKLVANLEIQDFRNISLEKIHQAVRDEFLSGGIQKFWEPLTDENIQPRCRMIILMVISSEENALLLTTGNKSEMALGYYTLYGDGAGGLAVISDIYKTMVREICIMLNKYAKHEIIPVSTIEKPPSAELAPDQLDTDSLPPYELLDPTLDDLLSGMPLAEVKRRSKIPELVEGLVKKIAITEYKRKQAPVSGAKLTMRAFGSGRLMPVAKKVTYV